MGILELYSAGIMAHRRLARELLSIQIRRNCHPNKDGRGLGTTEGFWDGAIDGWHAAPLVNEAGEENIMVWILKICGPVGTPYYGGTFCCRLEFPKDYPFKAPAVVFETNIVHPIIKQGNNIYSAFFQHDWGPWLAIPDVARYLVKLLREPEIFSDNGGWHRTNLYCRVDPAAFVQQAHALTLQHAFGAHSHALCLVYSAAAASSIFIGRKFAREFRIMRDDAHLTHRQRVLESAPLQRTVTQRTRMQLCTCSTLLSFVACRLALAHNQLDVGFRRRVIALVLKRWFRGAAWQLWTRLC